MLLTCAAMDDLSNNKEQTPSITSWQVQYKEHMYLKTGSILEGPSYMKNTPLKYLADLALRQSPLLFHNVKQEVKLFLTIILMEQNVNPPRLNCHFAA